MEFSVIGVVDVTERPHSIEDGHHLVAHPIITSLIGGGAKFEAIYQRIEVFR